MKYLEGTAQDIDALIHINEYDNFISTLAKSSDGFDDVGYLTWFIDSDNHIYGHINNDVLTISVVEDGSTVNYTTPLNISTNAVANLKLIKSGSDISLLCYLNDDINSVIELKAVTTLNGGKLAIGTRTGATGNEVVKSASITNIAHAHHADIAEVAKGLTEQARCKHEKSTDQSIPNSTYTVVTFEDELFDNQDIKESDDSTFTVRETGLYLVVASLTYAANSTGVRDCVIRKNGTRIQGMNQNTVSVGITSIQATAIIYLDKDDALDVLAYQTSGSSLNLYSNERYTNMLITKIG